MGFVSRLSAAVIGDRFELPSEMLARYPDLAKAEYRRGGLPVRIGGWALGTSTAAAITLRPTIFAARSPALTAELLLHDLRHVPQFQETGAFPVSYLWQSLRYGYTRNAYEVDARRYSASRLGTADKEF